MGEITVKESKQAPTGPQPKKKRMWWRILLAFLGGFIFFPLCVAGAGAIVGTVLTTSQVISMTGNDPEQVIGAEYRDKTILQTVMALMQKKFDTLGDLNDVTPLVKKTFDEQINPALKEAIKFEFNWEEVKTHPFQNGTSENKALGEYLQEALTNGVKIANLVKDVDNLKGVYNYFLYDVQKDENGNVIYDADGNVTIDKTKPYSIADFMNGADFLNGVMDYIKIGDVVEVTSTSPKILQTMQNWRVGNINEKVETLKIGSLFTESEINGNPLLKSVQNYTLNDLSKEETIDTLKVGDLIGDSESTLMTKIGTFYVANLKGYTVNVDGEGNKTVDKSTKFEMTEHLLISDIYGPNPDSALMKALIERNYTVADLSDEDKIMSLKLKEVISDIDENSILNSYKEETLSELKNKDVNTIYLTDILKEEVYTNPSNPKYNKVIAAILKNERHDRFLAAVDAGYIGTEEEWLNVVDPVSGQKENAKYKATVNTLTNYDSIKNLKLEDVVENTSNNKVLTSLFAAGATVGNMNEKINTLKLGDVIDTSTLAEGSVAKNFITAIDADPESNIGNLGEKIGDVKMGDAFGLPKKDDGTFKIWSEYTNEEKASSNYVLCTLANTSLDGLKTKMSNLKLGEVLEIEEGSLLDYDDVKNSNINDSDAIITAIKNNAKLSQLISVGEDSPKILKTLTDYQGLDVNDKPVYGPNGANITNLETKLKTLKLNEVITVDAGSSQILKSLQNTTVFGEGTDNLEYSINHLKFNQVFTEEQCTGATASDIMKVLWEENDDGDFEVTAIPDKVAAMKLYKFLGNKIYEDQDPTKPISYTWWYLLTSEHDYDPVLSGGNGLTTASREVINLQGNYLNLVDGLEYKIGDMNNLVSNMTFHMKNENLFSLKAAGFINISDETLGKKIPVGTYAGVEVGELTITQFLKAIEDSHILID